MECEYNVLNNILGRYNDSKGRQRSATPLVLHEVVGGGDHLPSGTLVPNESCCLFP